MFISIFKNFQSVCLLKFVSKLISSQPRNKSALRGHYVNTRYKPNVLPNIYKVEQFGKRAHRRSVLYSGPSLQDWCKSAGLSTSPGTKWGGGKSDLFFNIQPQLFDIEDNMNLGIKWISGIRNSPGSQVFKGLQQSSSCEYGSRTFQSNILQPLS